MQNIVIIGGGQAAAWAVHTLRGNAYEGKISVVSDEQGVFYERPPLSKDVLLGTMTDEALQIFQKEVVDGFNVDFNLSSRAVSIDRANKIVVLDDGSELPYDKLLIATGSKARVPNEEWLSLKNVYTLRTIADSLHLNSLDGKIKNIGVVGGGWIGLEIAASLQKKGVQVTVLELADRLCGRSVSHDVSELLKKIHLEENVELNLGCGEISLKQANNERVQILLNAQEWKTFDAVLLGAGAHINKELAEEAGLDTDMGIIVNEFSETSDPAIYAAGDVAQHPQLGYCVQSWANAQNQAISAAKNMLGIEDVYEEIPWLWSDQYDCNIQILGYPTAIESSHFVLRDLGDRKKSFFYLDKENRLRYLVSINDAKTIKIAKRWMKAGMVLNPDDLSNPGFNLMSIKVNK